MKTLKKFIIIKIYINMGKKKNLQTDGFYQKWES